MLDQNVPNPLAKNPNFHTHKVLAAIGIILIVAIIAIGGTWYFVQSAEDKAPVTNDSTVTKVATSSVKTKDSTTPVIKDETADWKTYKSSAGNAVYGHKPTTVNYSFKHPNGWFEIYNGAEAPNSISSVNEPTGSQIPGELDVSVNLSLDEFPISKDATKTKLDNRTAWKNVTIGNGSDTLVTRIEYLVESIITKEGDTIKNGLSLNCNFYKKSGLDLEKTCDLIASTFKFL